MSVATGPFDLSQFPPEYLAEDRGQQLINAAITFGVLEIVFFALFLIARFMNKTANGLDFFLMPAAFIMCFSHVPMMIAFVKYAGAGRHFVVVSPEQFVLWSKLIFVEEFTYVISVTLPKLAILALYMRIFTTRPYRWAVYGIAVIMAMNIIADVVLALITCKPIAANWDMTIPGGYCNDKMGPYRWISVPNVTTDAFMLLLPLPVIWRLQTGRKNKIGLTITFLTGSVGIITSILRFVTFFAVNLFADPTFNVIETMTWTCTEPGVYFIAATLPSLRPLLRILVEKTHIAKALSYMTKLNASHTKKDTVRPGEQKMSRSKGTFDQRVSSNKLGGFDILRETDIEIERESNDDASHLVQRQDSHNQYTRRAKSEFV